MKTDDSERMKEVEKSISRLLEIVENQQKAIEDFQEKLAELKVRKEE